MAGLGLGGCTLTRDLWQEDNANGRKWASVPVTLEAIESDDRQSRVHLMVRRDADMKIQVQEGQFRVRSFSQGERLVFSLNDPSIVWLLGAVEGAPPGKKHELEVLVEADSAPVHVTLRLILRPDSGKLFTPYDGTRTPRQPYEQQQPSLRVLAVGVDRLGAIYTGHQRDSDVPRDQWSHHFRFAGWIASDGRMSADVQALEIAIKESLAERSWQRLKGMSAIIEAEASIMGRFPAWTVPMEQVVKVGLLQSMSYHSVWNEDHSSSTSEHSLRMTDFGNFNAQAGISGRTPVPAYRFWPTVGRVIATPFAVIGDVVAWTTVVVTAPIWGAVLLKPHFH